MDAVDEHNGVSVVEPITYDPINHMYFSDLYDKANMKDVEGVINDILRKESPIPLDVLYNRVSMTYSMTQNDISDGGECIAGGSNVPINKDEIVKRVVDDILDSSEFSITEALNGERCVVWPSTKVGNYCQCRRYGEQNERPFKIDYISIIELRNAIKYHYYKGRDDDEIISDAFIVLGCDEFDKYRGIAKGLLDEVKDEVLIPDDYLPEILKGDSKQYLTYGFPQLFRPSEFNGGFDKKPIQLTVDYFFIRSERIIDIIVSELKKAKGVKLCSPMDSGYHVGCTYEKSLYGSISFTVERGLHPITIIESIIDKVNRQYSLDIQFTDWKPYIDKESALKRVKYRTVDGIVA